MKRAFRKSFLFFIAALVLISAAALPKRHILRIGFDIDDTLIFSTPAFAKAFQSKTVPFSAAFWKIVNKSDSGISIVKKKSYEIVKKYEKAGDEVYAITARYPNNGKYLKDFINAKFGIPKSHIFFAPNGKAKKMKELKLNIFYGDSDSDMVYAKEAGATPIRIMRSKKSSYKRNYHPGKYGEKIIPKSNK